MEKIVLTLISWYFGILSRINPKVGAEQAIKLFQRPRRIPLKKREQKFYDTWSSFQLKSEDGIIHCYEKGDSTNPLIIMVHGWDSNAGSISGIANKLIEEGYYVVTFDLPAHGKSMVKYTNLLKSSKAMKVVLEHLKPYGTPSIISHSFGSAVTSYTLEQTQFQVNQLVYLTTPNSLYWVFQEFQRMISLGDASFKILLDKGKQMIGEPIQNLVIADRIHNLKFEHLTFIHDFYDKILPYENSKIMHERLSNSTLITLEHAGHYRMLWNDEVYEHVIKIINEVYKAEPVV